MEQREVIQVDITDTPEPYDEISPGELEAAKILRMDPMHFHRMIDLYMRVCAKQAGEKMNSRKKIAAEKRTIVD